MDKTIKTEVRGADALALFWGQYFQEVPVCSHPDCVCVASQVDAFFPYIDDFNRCESHPLEVIGFRRPAACCGHGAAVGTPARIGKGGPMMRLSWRPPRMRPRLK